MRLDWGAWKRSLGLCERCGLRPPEFPCACDAAYCGPCWAVLMEAEVVDADV